jgi:hypothetical protein
MRPSLAALVSVLLLACSGGGGSTASVSASPVGTAEPSPQAHPSGKLDDQVAMPEGFPADVPIYTKARLTAGAAFASSGQKAWGMEWQTADGVDKVRAFYADKLSHGDWTINFTDTASGSFSATFARKSNSQVQGTLKSNVSSGVTKILMSLVVPA